MSVDRARGVPFLSPSNDRIIITPWSSMIHATQGEAAAASALFPADHPEISDLYSCSSQPIFLTTTGGELTEANGADAE